MPLVMALWLDNWHTLGPLFQRFGNRVVFNLGRSLRARVCSIIVSNENIFIFFYSMYYFHYTQKGGAI